MSESLDFLFYGVSVNLNSNSNELLERIKNDFNYFLTEKLDLGCSNIRITANLKKVDINSLRQIFTKRRYFFRETETFDNKRERLNIYENRMVSQYDFKNEVGQITGEEINLLHEIAYLLILSRVGKLHDLKGIHRLHAMFAQKNNKSILAVGSSGAGKSTLLLNLCKNGSSFGSDDVTLINSDGHILPFPIRAGSSKKIEGFDNYFVLNRREFGTKYLYDFTKKLGIAKVSEKAIFLLLEKGSKGIKKSNFFTKLLFLFKFLVIGIGTPQIFEYFWESGFNDFFIKVKIFFLRLFCMLKIIFSNKFYNLSTFSEDDALKCVNRLLEKSDV